MAQMGVSKSLDFSQVIASAPSPRVEPQSLARLQATARERELISTVKDRLFVALDALEEAVEEVAVRRLCIYLCVCIMLLVCLALDRLSQCIALCVPTSSRKS